LGLAAITVAACDTHEPPLELASASGVVFDPAATRPPADYAPLALATASIGRVTNPDANIPPLCYTRSDGIANPCWTCHTHSKFPNLADDWQLQQNYSFPETAKQNRWKNLFRSRGALVDNLTDAVVTTYVRTDNYTPLVRAIAATPDFPGWRPDLDLSRGFDADGFAIDGSGWRAVRYKPFPGTFWPTNGSADDVFVRLPAEFRRAADGSESRPVYRANLAILEAAIASDPRDASAELRRTIEAIDERAIDVDLDRDGTLGLAREIVGLPSTFVGGAAHVGVTRLLYPEGVEFLHSVRYLDPDAPSFAARRMKELRYARKTAFVGREDIVAAYRGLEAPDAGYGGDPLAGLTNAFGWQLQGWIEDARGWLRLQTHEEHTYCMGCHTGLGVTVDQTFAFARKVPGADGWRLQDIRGIPDAPQIGHDVPEAARWLERAHGGDELRNNLELLSRFFPNGTMDGAAVAETRSDVSKLLLPSRARALDLDRAYLANVIEQSFIWGRDAIREPAKNVSSKIEERSTGIGEAGLTVRDGRLHLDWPRP
jgi:hypothetical protein